MSGRGWGVLAIWMLLVGGYSAAAQTPGGAVSDPAWPNISYSIWFVRDSRVMLRFLVPASEAQRAVGAGPPLLIAKRFGSYLLAHSAVRAAGEGCPAENQGYDIGRVNIIGAGKGLYGFEIFFRCPSSGAMTLEEGALFDRVAGQVNFARIELRNRLYPELFTASRERVTLPEDGAGPSADWGAYAKLGATHVLHSAALWCLLLGVVWLLLRAPSLRWMSAALAAGYLVSTGGALGGWVAPRAELLSAFGGFLAALLPLQYIARGLRHPERAAAGSAAVFCALASVAWGVHLAVAAVLLAGVALLAGGALAGYVRRSNDASLGVAVIFVAALLDGFALPQQIAPLQLPVAVRLPMLAGFDAGSALAAAAIVVFALAVRRLSNSQLASPLATLASDLAAAACGLFGVFWLVSKSFAS